jgi:predicted acetyltransferase
MPRVILRNLTKEDKEEFLLANGAEWGDFSFAHYWESLANENFDKFISIVPEFSQGKHLPDGHVACTFLFAFNEDGRIVGRTSIRHELTDHLLKVGGHVGYGVVPEFRRLGYATEILTESIRYISENIQSLSRVLVTCDEDNIGSRKTIEKNRGVLENIIPMESGPNKMRFWIEIDS